MSAGERPGRQPTDAELAGCTCPAGRCTRGEFRDHQGDSPGCMACADLDPDQSCLAGPAAGPSDAELAEAQRINRELQKRAAYIDGLRQLADALEAHPELPLPYEGDSTEMTFHFLFGDDPRAAMAAAARALPCTWRKKVRDYDDGSSYLDLHGELAGLKVRLNAFRDAVCTRRVVGTEEREVEEEVTPAVTRKVKRQVDVVEWDCQPILNGGQR